MRVSSYSSYHSYVGKHSMTINVQFETNDFKEGLAFQKMVDVAYKSGQEVDGEQRTITPDKIFRCGDATTVIWKDGTKTTVKLMKGADDSDYGAFTAALAKKIYGSNSKVMRYAGMVQRVKTKAEKKATRKLKRKYEEKITGEKKYIVSQYGQVAECKGIETDSMGIGEKVIVFAKTHDKAREEAYVHFVNTGFGLFSVCDNGRVEKELGAYLIRYFGVWRKSLIHNSAYVTAVFARSQEEALKILEINPAPKEGDKP